MLYASGRQADGEGRYVSRQVRKRREMCALPKLRGTSRCEWEGWYVCTQAGKEGNRGICLAKPKARKQTVHRQAGRVRDEDTVGGKCSSWCKCAELSLAGGLHGNPLPSQKYIPFVTTLPFHNLPRSPPYFARIAASFCAQNTAPSSVASSAPPSNSFCSKGAAMQPRSGSPGPQTREGHAQGHTQGETEDACMMHDWIKTCKPGG